MTNQEYLTQMFNELFDATLPVEELIKNKTYRDFEDSIREIIVEDFTRIGCDTSNGAPTEVGMILWMNSKLNQKLIDKLDKFKMLQ